MNKKNGILLLLATAFISGFSIFLNAYAVKGFDSSVFTFAKNATVSVLLIAFVLLLGQYRTLISLRAKVWAQLSLVGLIGGSIPFLLFFKGLQTAGASSASFIHKLLFLFVTVLAVFFLKEKPNRWLFAGTALLLAGTYLVIKPDFTFSFGHGLILVATLLWAAETTYSKHLLHEVPASIVALGRMFFGSVFILLFLVASGKASIVLSMSVAQYMWIGVTSVLLFLYVLTFYHGLATVRASTAVSILSLGALVTALLDVGVRGVFLSLESTLGMLLLIGGVIILALFQERVVALPFPLMNSHERR